MMAPANSFILAESTIANEIPKANGSTPMSHGQKLQTPTEVVGNVEEVNKVVIRNVIGFLLLHMAALYGIYLSLTVSKWSTNLYTFSLASVGSMGITAGAHRLWAHKAYKATWQLRLILMFFNTLAFQNSIFEWVRDHRVHHKFTDTDADPHNSTRGFFFSHVGWLLVRKHPEIKAKGQLIDMTDLEQDGIVMFQKKHYLKLMPLCCFIIPAMVPYFLFGEQMYVCWYVAAFFRYVLSLHATWLVNSAAHMWGMRPYEKSITPTDSKFVALAAFGEGWHNYHHVFPWDYKAAELGNYTFNLTTGFIDLFSRIGWAYDLKTVSEEMITKRALRTGDGSRHFADTNGNKSNLDSHHHHHHDTENLVWGWGDKDMLDEDMKDAKILKKID